MADQKKWFKVWASILIDPHMSGLSLQDMGRWVRLGAFMMTSGERGKLMIPNPSPLFLLAMEVESLSDARMALLRLPNVQIRYPLDPHENDNGSFIVIIKNWFKYQVDSTSYERVKRSRYKKRRDKKREEESDKHHFLSTPEIPKWT